MMEKCLDCGTVLEEDALTCPGCGKRMADVRCGGDRREGEDRRHDKEPFDGKERRRSRDRRSGTSRRKFSY